MEAISTSDKAVNLRCFIFYFAGMTDTATSRPIASSVEKVMQKIFGNFHGT